MREEGIILKGKLALFFNLFCGIALMSAYFLAVDRGIGTRMTALAAFCFFLASWGIYSEKRIIQYMGGVPIICLFLLLGLFVFSGGWIWGPSEAGKMYLFAMLFLVISVLEFLSLLVS
ncbi:MAG TPA: hypothetical protein PLV56_04875 [Synergistales bacterium]|nr:hypothetical protein [Synergistales bacterium]